jgi:putative transferase (TIGR04331 family)
LNEIHHVEHGARYWRILIGPWLGYFIQILFDRWTSIQKAVAGAESSETIILKCVEGQFTPQDMCDFGRLFSEDEWNHHIYAIILKEFTDVKCMEQAGMVANKRSTKEEPIGAERRFQRMLAKWYSGAAGLLAGQRDAFLLATYLPVLDEVRLHWRLGQVPQLWRPVPPFRGVYDQRQRLWGLDGESRSEFETCVRRLIPRQIPVLYLEGYAGLMRQTASLPWPRQPKIIWTTSSEIADDVFKAWAARKVEGGAPLVIGQHGGHYGIGQWSFTEDHQIAISDRYLTWGWSDSACDKVVPVGQFKAKYPLGIRHAKQPRALLVMAVHPRYSYWMYSTPIANQWVNYFEEQFRFVESLTQSLQQALTIRLYPQDFGWDQLVRWRERFPELCLDGGGSSITEEIRQSRLYISTYNATTFLESFTMNVPTVIYWNPHHWELRETARPYFEELKRVGIFHESPESAALHVAQIWVDVDAWWNNKEVREVLGNFKSRFCHLPDNLLDCVELTLRGVMADSQN